MSLHEQALEIFSSVTKVTPNLINFLLKVQEKYLDIPYHNFQHAVYVLQQAAQLAKQSNLDPQMKLTLYISAICHDIGHPGTSNKYQELHKTEYYSPLGSSLERFHFKETCKILKEDNFTGIPLDVLLPNVEALILATDLKNGAGIVRDAEALQSPRDHVVTFLRLIMAASDLYGFTKGFDFAEKECEKLFQEQEMFEVKDNTPQTTFIKSFCLPKYKCLNSFIDCNEMISNIEECVKRWSSME